MLEAPSFWWRERSIAGYALAPLGALYGAVAARRMRRPGRRAPIPVICVGGLTLGGAGKTPTALAVAALAAEMGRRPGFVSRGYGGGEPGPVLVDPTRHSAAEVGDEPLLLARAFPTVAGRDRLAGVRLLARLGCDLAVMDDGLQSPSPAKDLTLAVVDSGHGIGNGLVFPAGPLRAPLAAQTRRADAVLLVGSEPGRAARVARAAARCGVPVLSAHAEPARRRGLNKRKRYLAFAGIAHPAKFYDLLRATGARLEATADFPDHYPFSEADCQALLDRAEAQRLTLITTEKDMVRLAGRNGAAGQLAEAAQTFPIRMVLEEPRRLVGLVEEALAVRARGV
jgi:tetraacyldisaccharide 4'-kinase